MNFFGTNHEYIKDKTNLFDKNVAGKYNFPNPHGGGTAYTVSYTHLTLPTKDGV